ncbi:MAG: glycosyltransferase family 2 protein [Acidobacteriaceae bacterium]|jgi:dolichol-phosphate mannosyltransferase
MSSASSVELVESSTASLPASLPEPTALDLAVVLPTYNERDNIPLVIAQLTEALRGLAWEAVFVDDDSPDGTAAVISAHARWDSRIRLIHRVGRRGLSSACIEGMMSTTAPVVAVMDADLQHDASILPRMLDRLREDSLDVVIGTRNSDGGSMGEFGPWRVKLSHLGQKISQSVCHAKLTDPMSGFFLLRRTFLLEVVHDLQGGGFKILVDLLASSQVPVRYGEVGYRFGARRHGESKLDVVVGIEYLFLVLNKRLGGVVPLHMALYALVGGIGLAAHLLVFLLFSHVFAASFVAAQIAATFVAMIENFTLNNLITFRSRRLRGGQMWSGLARFVMACSFGAVANVVFARALWQGGVEWYLAGFAGIVLGSVWNLSVSSMITWGMRSQTRQFVPSEQVMVSDVEVSR